MKSPQTNHRLLGAPGGLLPLLLTPPLLSPQPPLQVFAASTGEDSGSLSSATLPYRVWPQARRPDTEGISDYCTAAGKK
ncbi:hypothetical protein P167DRAFT_580705 [Morchella conica CCBAS932]|uniref:Uncharacterized protein n=1 Tax=Morchella conica CCBAS932 TaxID=1392247 RepID=A0A3N4KAG9_9PEZI|nr:hypothetical protein P167DRAFT_580705 [Morchella conica CCBAS932]